MSSYFYEKNQTAVKRLTPPYVIAEIGVNHEGSIEKAIKMIDDAKKGGANAVKFQSYKAQTLASKNSPAYWDTTKEPTLSQFELFKKYDSFGQEEYIKLSEYCNKLNIDFLCTPFDDESIEFLDPLMPFYKIASADITNIPFLRKVAQKKKPVVLSTGAATLAEIQIAVLELQKKGATSICLMHCILNYPTVDDNANLSMIGELKNLYPDFIIGYSDHTLPDPGMLPLITAFLLGARVIEKHFTFDKKLPGNDHYHAMDWSDLSIFTGAVAKICTLAGEEVTKKPIESEEIARKNARRSLVAKKDLRVGEIFSEENLTYKRPGTGISPIHWDLIIGKTAARNIESDHILNWDDIEGV
ncbi:N-acetylneuraminate synthase family protein [Polynucleobacter sp. AP-Ainpum-60-G11]|uniref:N-acetylneuraminate synthase family protein n=1 Tax=Polynucleobacter sp. AP-Ainpum-60-G11 TaxID=2576926 RepID=UPI001BFDF827|nr:N-acetylneuraminate synthase family protein [Polynucleobacter sp. AP-Ainpum-60-G11]QWE27002.1 N-acetylneuraminate synthase family protein [Polynucleobacter sp. AP-Ainpum-60-G11]